MADLSSAGFYAGDRDDRFRAYILSAAFVQFLRDRLGVAKLAEFWRAGPESSERILGSSLPALEAEWTSALRQTGSAVGKINLVAVQRAGCLR